MVRDPGSTYPPPHEIRPRAAPRPRRRLLPAPGRVALVLAATALLACRARDTPRGPPPPPAPEPPPALLFGFSPAHGAAEAARRGEHLAAYLSARLNKTVRPFVASSYGSLVHGLRSGRVDFGWLPPLVYVVAHRRGGVQPVVKFARSGRGDYYGALIVRKDSPIHEIGQLAGKRIAWTDPRSSAGYLFPRAYLVESGIDPDRFFGAQSYLGSHRRVVEAVLDRKVDVGATYFIPGPGNRIVTSAWSQQFADRAGEIRILARTGSIPSDVIASRRGIPARVGLRLRRIFLEMNQRPTGRTLLHDIFGAERALPALHTDYRRVERMARALRLQ